MLHKILLLLLLSLISSANLEEYRKLRPINDMSFTLLNAKISFQFRYREDLRYSVQNEMLAQAVDGSISHIPVRSPHFLGRYALIQRKAKDVTGRDIWQKQFLKQQYFSNLFILDYEEQFFPQAPIIIDLKGTKVLDKSGLVGLQERYYFDGASQKLEFYIYTNMFPNHVPEAIPFVSDWRTNIELKVAIPTSMGYSVLTSGREESGIYIYNRTCLSDISFAIVNAMETHDHKVLKFSGKTGHGKRFPLKMKEFEEKAVKMVPEFDSFIGFKYTNEALRLHLVTLPALNVRPMVLGKGMCLFDQDWIATQTESHEFYLRHCFIHQFFISTLLPYSPPVRFISDGLAAYYSVAYNLEKGGSEEKLCELFHQVLGDEERRETAVVLFRDYQEELQLDKRRTNKAAYLMHMIMTHMEDPKVFHKIIHDFMDKFRNKVFTYDDFSIAFWAHYKKLHLNSYDEFRHFINSWTNSTGYPLLSVKYESNSLTITSKLTANSLRGSTILFPIHLHRINKNGVLEKPLLLWMDNFKELSLPYDTKEFPYYLVNAFRNSPARTMYPVEYWEEILSAGQMIPFKARVVLLNDAYYFYSKGQLDYITMFKFLRWLRNEKSLLMWTAMEPVIMDMNRRWLFTDLHSRIGLIVRESIGGFYKNRLEHNNSLAVKLACWARLPECLEDSEKTLREFIANQEWRIKMHLDVTLCGGMRRIKPEMFQQMVQLGKRVWMKRDVILMAMCCNENEWDLELFLRALFTRNEFQLTRDFKYQLLLNTFMSSETGAEVVWRFVDRKHEELLKLFGRAIFLEFSSFLAQFLKRKSQHRSMKLIFQKFDLPEGNVFQRILVNKKNIDRDQREIYNYLTNVILEKTNL